MKVLFYLSSILLCFSCAQYSDRKIVGNWETFDTWDRVTREEIASRLIFRSDFTFEDVDDPDIMYDIKGTWRKTGNRIMVDYEEGTGTTYQIITITDSTMILSEDGQVLKYQRVPFKKDTLNVDETGQPEVLIRDFDTKEPVTALRAGEDYWLWMEFPELPNYGFRLKTTSGGKLIQGGKRTLFELQVDSLSSDPVVIEGMFDFKGDSIFVRKHSKNSHNQSDDLSLYDGKIFKTISVSP